SSPRRKSLLVLIFCLRGFASRPAARSIGPTAAGRAEFSFGGSRLDCGGPCETGFSPRCSLQPLSLVVIPYSRPSNRSWCFQAQDGRRLFLTNNRSLLIRPAFSGDGFRAHAAGFRS